MSPCRSVFVSGAVGVIAVVVIVAAAGDTGSAATPEYTVVRTKLGDVRGAVRSYSSLRVREFLGIRYAQPPTGGLRFSKPLPVQPWSPQTYDALSTGSWCTQAAFMSQGFIGSEDCLFLNVYAPYEGPDAAAAKGEGAAPRAVMVYVHGGGFIIGSGSQYPGPGLAGVGDVVVVSINYRLGVFGFLSTTDQYSPGNYGLWDQRAAFIWVREHIAAFGGDPTRITIFGESAGAANVNYQAISPHNDQTLFQRVIAESASIHAPFAFHHAPLQSAMGVALKVACPTSPSASLVECLRSKSVGDLMAHAPFLLWAPSVDGEFILDSPDVMSRKALNGSRDAYLENFSKYDYLVGFNSQDGLLFIDLPTSTPSINSISKNLTGNDVSNGLTEEVYNHAIKLIGQLYYGDEPSVDLFVNYVKLLYETAHWQQLESHPPDAKDRLWLYIQILGDFQLVAPAIHTINLHATLNGTGKRYHYLYDVRRSFVDQQSAVYTGPVWLRKGADHMDELASVLAYPFLQGHLSYENVFYQHTYTDEEKALSVAVVKYWANFAKNGDPNVGKPLSKPWCAWKSYDLMEKNYLLIKINESTMRRGDRSQQDILWNHLVASSRQHRSSATADGERCTSTQPSTAEQGGGIYFTLNDASVVSIVAAFVVVCVGMVIRNGRQ